MSTIPDPAEFWILLVLGAVEILLGTVLYWPIYRLEERLGTHLDEYPFIGLSDRLLKKKGWRFAARSLFVAAGILMIGYAWARLIT